MTLTATTHIEELLELEDFAPLGAMSDFPISATRNTTQKPGKGKGKGKGKERKRKKGPLKDNKANSLGNVTGRGLRHMPLSSRIANQSQINYCAFWSVGRVVKATVFAPLPSQVVRDLT
jgi:hypothetical protein